ncbi:MAG: metallophosphoesterase [Planctomycetaceae bacterium]|nr:metallophosphoesterase [Planctomycetaceae bacterium]
MSDGVFRVGAVADIHYGRESRGHLRSLFEEAARRVDLLLLAGDLTDYGLPEEIDLLIDDLAAAANLPIVAVLGNHDYESGREQELTERLRHAGVHLLDGEAFETEDVGVVGVKGFGGGFGRGTLEPWGEAGVKRYVQEAADESMKLERGLARLQAPRRIALLHYAPIRETVIGEPEEIFPFLGSGRLEEPLNRFEVSAVFHGHAHRGALEGRTSGGVPVYNVALPLLKHLDPEGLPFRVLELAKSVEA